MINVLHPVRRLLIAVALITGVTFAISEPADAVPTACYLELMPASEGPNVNDDLYMGTITIGGVDYLYNVWCGVIAVVNVS